MEKSHRQKCVLRARASGMELGLGVPADPAWLLMLPRFALKAIMVCLRNYRPFAGCALCRAGRDLCDANSTELHYIGGILYTRSQHVLGARRRG